MIVPQRGEIYWLDFSPATGVEMHDPHPALIIQNDIGNQASAATIVLAITSNLRVAQLPVGVQIEPRESGLSRPSVVHAGHIYTVDKARLGQRAGHLSATKMQQVDVALQISLGLRPFSFGRAGEQHTTS